MTNAQLVNNAYPQLNTSAGIAIISGCFRYVCKGIVSVQKMNTAQTKNMYDKSKNETPNKRTFLDKEYLR
jgi:hypothetical protein